LSAFITATKQDNYFPAGVLVIDSVAGAVVDTHFRDTFPDRLNITTGITFTKPLDPSKYAVLCAGISKTCKPSFESLRFPYLFHVYNVTYMLHCVKDVIYGKSVSFSPLFYVDAITIQTHPPFLLLFSTFYAILLLLTKESIMKRAKIIALSLTAIIAISLLLAACFSDWMEQEEMAVFTIDFGGTSRTVGYPPTDPTTVFPQVSDLKFVVHLIPTASPGANGEVITKEGAGTISGTIAPGEYNVTIDIFFAADDTLLYASGGAIDSSGASANPVTVIAGSNTIPVGVTQQYLEDGTASYPFLVYDETTMLAVGRATAPYAAWDLTKHYELMRSITITAPSFPPIGSGTSNFIGSFGGNGKTISNLNISGTGHVGLFALIYGSAGIVKDLGLANVTVTATGSPGNFVGGIAGECDLGTIKNCYVTGSVSGNEAVGGIVGCNNGATVKDCYVTGSVTGNKQVGGIVGENQESKVSYSYATATVAGNDNVGGIAGYSYSSSNGIDSTVVNCYYAGTVTGVAPSDWVGGVVGKNESEGSGSSIVKNCYSTGTVTGVNEVGGVVGFSGTTVIVANTSLVQNCYTTSTVTGAGYVGGIVGYNLQAGTKSAVENCVALNSDLACSGAGYQRVAGVNNSGTMTNNFGRDNMKLNNGSYTWTPNPVGEDGDNLTSAQWGNVSLFWEFPTGDARFDPAVWDFCDITATNNKLPILKDMPCDRAQNPAVP